MPIYEVELPLPEGGDTEFVGLVPPGQTIRRPAPESWRRSYVEPGSVEIEFLDSTGRRWTRNAWLSSLMECQMRVRPSATFWLL